MAINFLLRFTMQLLTEEQLKEVATESGVLSIVDDFLTLEFKEECERIIPDNDTIEPDAWKDVYVYSKQNFTL